MGDIMSFATTVLYVLWILGMLWVWYDVWTYQKKMKQSYKWLWTILAIIPIIVAGIYYFVVKKD